MERQYSLGYVGVIDILGFGSFTKNKSRFSAIIETLEAVKLLEKNLNYNSDSSRIISFSDTIVVITKIDNDNKFDYAYLKQLISLLIMLRGIITDKMGLYTRGSVTIGEYYYDEKKKILFGPAITRAVKLAECASEFICSENLGQEFKDRPSALLIDKLFLNNSDQLLSKQLKQNGVASLFRDDTNVFVKSGPFYYVNQYFWLYEEYYKNKMLGKDMDESELLSSFIKIEETKLNKQKEKQEKYQLEKRCFNDFVNDISNSNLNKAPHY